MGRVLSALYGGLLLSTVTFASWAQDDPSDIALTFTNDLPVPRAAEPVACGVPLVPGYVERPEELSLLGPGGALCRCRSRYQAHSRTARPDGCSRASWPTCR